MASSADRDLDLDLGVGGGAGAGLALTSPTERWTFLPRRSGVDRPMTGPLQGRLVELGHASP